MFDAAIGAAQPALCLPPHLPARPKGRLIVIGAGKASAAMAKAVEDHWQGPLSGLVITRYGHGVPIRTINGRDDLLQAVTAALAGLQEARIQLHRVHVSVDPGRQSATAQLVAAAYLNGSGEPMVQELRMRLRKIEDHWKIVQVETVKTLGP